MCLLLQKSALVVYKYLFRSVRRQCQGHGRLLVSRVSPEAKKLLCVSCKTNCWKWCSSQV